MKVTKTQWTLEGTSEEIAAVLPRLNAQLDQPTIDAKVDETDESGQTPPPAPAANRALIDFIKQVMNRRATPFGQKDLFEKLLAAPNGICRNELAPAMKRSLREFAGLIGALGHRTTYTPGYTAQRDATGREGVTLLLSIESEGDDVRYALRPETRTALEELGRA